jgi:hypothetical protein
MGFANRLLAQLHGMALGCVAQALVIVGVQVGVHGIPFWMEPL